MRKFLLAATILAPFAIGPAYAAGGTLSGDLKVTTTAAGSTASVASDQGTHAQVMAGRTGGVVVGAVSGNYTSVDTSALGKAGGGTSYTNTTATQTNVGGTLAGGLAINAGRSGPFSTASSISSNGATGTAGGGQNSQAGGSSAANASTTNISGVIKLQTGHNHGGGPR